MKDSSEESEMEEPEGNHEALELLTMMGEPGDASLSSHMQNEQNAQKVSAPVRVVGCPSEAPFCSNVQRLAWAV